MPTLEPESEDVPASRVVDRLPASELVPESSPLEEGPASDEEPGSLELEHADVANAKHARKIGILCMARAWTP